MSEAARTMKAGGAAAWRSALTREELREILSVSSWRGFASIAVNWALVAACFALVAAWPNPFTVVLALFVIGARQLGMAVVMHEAAHRTLLRNRRLNDWAGSWLAAYPIWSDIHSYRPYHLRHHAKTGTAEDPDLGLVTPFPITRASLRRKIWRDLSGQTGVKFARAALRRSLSRWRAGDAAGRRAFAGMLATNALLVSLLAAAGRPELYLLWVAAWLTTHTLVTRIRAIAEHSMVPDQGHPLRNTRTTEARFWERLLIAPNFVNYHLEHHLLMTAPMYNLPRFHRLLRERGVLDEACVARGYPGVIALAASRADAARAAA